MTTLLILVDKLLRIVKDKRREQEERQWLAEHLLILAAYSEKRVLKN